jgi:anti-sigma regulatory factor (Ser/Thr protein kinase)
MTSATAALDDTLVLYGGEQELFDQLLPFVHAGVAAAEPVIVAFPATRLPSIAGRLDDAHLAVELADMTELGRNPTALISTYQRVLREYDGRPARLIGEFDWAGRTGEECAALAQHEALVNTAFADYPLRVSCLYNRWTLPQEVLSDARCAHPSVREHDHTAPSDRYAPDQLLARHNVPLAIPDHAATYTVRSADDLRGARHFAHEQLRARGLAADRIANTELTVCELATNSLRHSHAGCMVAVWFDGEDIVCTVRDTGQLVDPLAGRRFPTADQPDGRGLLIINHLARFVRTHTSPTATTIEARL